MLNLYGADESGLKNRDPKYKPLDQQVLAAIAQAAVEVELFTIPLYMSALYSISGFHQINSAGATYYKGRQWPGCAPTAEPQTANERAFNTIFSVFIQEMLHLQLASNMATTIGVTPVFTSPALVDERNGWICYGPTLTVIPHIIDLTDTENYADVKVNVGAVDEPTLKLFLAIEEPESDTKINHLKSKHKYFPKVPFDSFDPQKGLPLFGTIGYMYWCYYAYLQIEYSDNTTLWQSVYQSSDAQQNDLFNTYIAGGHPMREYPGMEATVANVYPDIAHRQMTQMMDAICDQGEGAVLPIKQLKMGLTSLQTDAVQDRYSSSKDGLESDYPSYNQDGVLVRSADAGARWGNDKISHYDRFWDVLKELGGIETWPQWLEKHKNIWTPDDFIFAEPPQAQPIQRVQLEKASFPELAGGSCGAPIPPSHLPTPADSANAMNAVSREAGIHTTLSQVVIGAIAGVTTVLDDYWNAQKQADGPIAFPMPSMSGSADRMAICWALTGKAPNLGIGLDKAKDGVLYHACQGLAWDYDGKTPNTCAAIEIFHTCKGSNGCHAQGGCGFAQSYAGGGSCGSSSCHASAAQQGTMSYKRRIGEAASQCGGGGGGGMCGGKPTEPGYQPASDNKCKAFGGCAVPISAYQVYPIKGTMALYSFSPDPKNPGGFVSDQIMYGPNPAMVQFQVGELVHDVAYKAYKEAMKVQNPKVTVPDNPPPSNNLRLVFPPST